MLFADPGLAGGVCAHLKSLVLDALNGPLALPALGEPAHLCCAIAHDM